MSIYVLLPFSFIRSDIDPETPLIDIRKSDSEEVRAYSMTGIQLLALTSSIYIILTHVGKKKKIGGKRKDFVGQRIGLQVSSKICQIYLFL